MKTRPSRRVRRAAWRASRRREIGIITRQKRGFDLFTPEAVVVADDRERRGVTRLHDTAEWRARWSQP